MINITKKHITLATFTLIVSVASYGFIEPANIETLTSFMSKGMQSQFAQMSFAFTLAAWVHSGRVKKEIKSNFDGLTSAINAVADAFRKDLEAQSHVLQDTTNLLAATISRVEVLESGKPKQQSE